MSEPQRCRDDLESLRSTAGTLSAAMRSTAERIERVSVAEFEQLLEALHDYRTAHAALSERVSEWLPGTEEEPSLDELEEAISTRERVVRARELVEAAMSITEEDGTQGEESSWLAECRAVETALSGPGRDDSTLGELESGRHPLSALLALVAGDDGMDDEDWQARFDAVRQAFGGAVAARAVRGRLRFPPDRVPDNTTFERRVTTR